MPCPKPVPFAGSALALALLLISALPAARPALAQGATPGAAGGGPAAWAAHAGRVVLRNARFDSVRVEVRAGPSSDCGQNVLIGVASLPRGSAWGITTDKPVCYRREEAQSSDQAAGPPAGALVKAWTAWARHVPARGQRVEKQL